MAQSQEARAGGTQLCNRASQSQAHLLFVKIHERAPALEMGTSRMRASIQFWLRPIQSMPRFADSPQGPEKAASIALAPLDRCRRATLILGRVRFGAPIRPSRSEEHTSELQSPCN